MRFNVDRICELAGLGAASGGLLSEAAVPAKPAAPVAKTAPAAPAGKPPVAPAGKSAPPKMEDAEEEEEEGMHYMDEDSGQDDYGMYEDAEEEEEGYTAEMGGYLDDDAMYEIDEMQLMEALVGMRQQRLEEAPIRDAVRDEIKRALSERGASWMYGPNKPTHSRVGQVSRGGFGIGFK